MTKQLRELPPLVYLGNVAELSAIADRREELWIGAGVTLTDAWPALLRRFPELEEQGARFASPPIRNSGTLCGNLANGSPIGDSIPALIALEAQIELRRGAAIRRLPLEDFYLGYQKKALGPGEFMSGVAIPAGAQGRLLASYKLSKRIDQDISAVCATFCVSLEGERVTRARLAFGGMAACAGRARHAEGALIEQRLDLGRVSRPAAPRSPRTSSRCPTCAPAAPIVCKPQATCFGASFWTVAQGARHPWLAHQRCPGGAPHVVCRQRRAMSIGTARTHDSAALHVSGQAQYCDDIVLPENTLHAAFGMSPIAHGRITALDLSAVATAPGVAAFAAADDVPGENNYGGAVHDDPIFAEDLVQYAGQPIFAVAANSMRAARIAARRAKLDLTPLPALLDIRAALAAESYVLPSQTMRRGDPQTELKSAPRRLSSTVVIGGQDHFYLEGHIAVALPQEDRGMLVHSSTQHPTEVQGIVAHALGLLFQSGHRAMPAHGRGLRRQGEPGRADRGRSGRAGAQDRQAGQIAPGPRHRHAHDRQAARLHRRLRGRLR